MISDRGSPRGIVPRRECRDVAHERVGFRADEPTPFQCLLAVQKRNQQARLQYESCHEANIAGRPRASHCFKDGGQRDANVTRLRLSRTGPRAIAQSSPALRGRTTIGAVAIRVLES